MKYYKEEYKEAAKLGFGDYHCIWDDIRDLWDELDTLRDEIDEYYSEGKISEDEKKAAELAVSRMVTSLKTFTQKGKSFYKLAEKTMWKV